MSREHTDSDEFFKHLPKNWPREVPSGFPHLSPVPPDPNPPSRAELKRAREQANEAARTERLAALPCSEADVLVVSQKELQRIASDRLSLIVALRTIATEPVDAAKVAREALEGVGVNVEGSG